MGVLLGISLLLFGAGFFARQAGQLPQRAWAGPRTATQRQRGPARPRSVRQEAKLAWAKVRAADWLEQQRHDRKNGTAAAAGRPPTPLAAARQRPQARRAGPLTVVPPAAQPRPPSPPQAAPAAPPSPGRNTAVSSTGNAVEQFVEGVNQIHAQAQAGGIHAKHAAVKACHEACVRFAAMAQMLSRQMSEPGMNYGNEITEPIAKSATQLQASAMTFSEADAALTTLENMTVGELAASSRQAPHHTELSENGSR